MPEQTDIENFIRRGSNARTAAEMARDRALQESIGRRKPWLNKALDLLANGLKVGWTGTGEDIRHFVSQSLEPPSTPNAWGAMCRVAAGQGLIEETGEWRKMQDKNSHARRTPVYRRIPVGGK